MIVSLPKSQTRHQARAHAPFPLHICFFDATNLYKPLRPGLQFILRVLRKSPSLCTETKCRELIPEEF